MAHLVRVEQKIAQTAGKEKDRASEGNGSVRRFLGAGDSRGVSKV